MIHVIKYLFKNKLALIGFVVIWLFSVSALLAPLVTPYAPDTQFFEGLTLEGAPLPPNGKFWLGTDLLGRDLFTRLIYGARTSLIIGIAANGIALLIGSFLGIFAGYARGKTGAVIMRFTDLMMAFPALLLAIALSAIFQPSLWIVALVIACVNWVQIARVIYGQTMSWRPASILKQSGLSGRPGPEFYLSIFCHISGPPFWSGEPSALPPRFCWKRPCRFLVWEYGHPYPHGAALSMKASLIFWMRPGWSFFQAWRSCYCHFLSTWWGMR